MSDTGVYKPLDPNERDLEEFIERLGQRLKSIRPMTKKELDSQYWDHRPWEVPMVLEFEDGSIIFASQDGEGNGPGALFGVDGKGKNFSLLGVKEPAIRPDEL